jgi:Cdc6-like AAA superfamily ATPase
MSRNPFGVLSPEQLDASYIAENFVDVFTDLPRLKDQCNTFIAGARGTGKSMLLRSLEPEVMLITKKAANLKDLPYLSVHVPLRKAEFGVTELRRLAGYTSVAIGEHLLTMQVTYRLAVLLESLGSSIEAPDASHFSTQFGRLFKLGGGTLSVDFAQDETDPARLFGRVKTACEDEIIRVRQYYTRLPFSSEKQEYEGALVGFLDFLVPMATEVSKFTSFSKVPLFVMLDDADNLPQHLQRIINSWVSTRSTHVVCLKITTQLGYATLRTIDNRLIESPHDFSDVNLSSIYTSEHNTYSNRVEQIVKRRLELARIQRSVDEFFPKDEAQAKRLKQIQEEIEEESQKKRDEGGPQRGASRSRDEVTRYAVPRLMRELAGSSRSSHTYSYAGFRSLVDLSSGVVRWFLEPASRMYDRVLSEKGTNVDHIPIAIQDKVVVEWANEFIQKLSVAKVDPPPDSLEAEDTTDVSLHAIGHETELYERLRNLC